VFGRAVIKTNFD